MTLVTDEIVEIYKKHDLNPFEVLKVNALLYKSTKEALAEMTTEITKTVEVKKKKEVSK